MREDNARHPNWILNSPSRENHLSTVEKDLAAQKKQNEILKNELKKKNDQLGKIRDVLQCQICLDVLQNPWVLNPCGHSSCQSCLQNWFTTQNSDDDQPEDYFRPKTCPTCRESIRTRPTQAFVIKDILEALGCVDLTGATSPATDDPWDGIFPPPGAEWTLGDHEGSAYDVEDYDDEDDEDEVEEYEGPVTSDEEDRCEVCGVNVCYREELCETCFNERDLSDGDYVLPTWEPPSVLIQYEEIVSETREERDRWYPLLRRGVTIDMIRRFHMKYSHETGIEAEWEPGCRMFLGWNLTLDDVDIDGAHFMEKVLEELYVHPERFHHIALDDGTITAWRLIHSWDREDFDDTDSDEHE